MRDGRAIRGSIDRGRSLDLRRKHLVSTARARHRRQFIARYRFVCLEMGSDRMRLPPDHIEVMIDRLGALNVEFEKFLVEVQ